MNKNTNTAKTGEIPTVDAKDMKAVTLSFEKFGFLRNVTAEEAGEFLQVILDYAMTGKMPEFKDKYQKMYYQTYLDVITEQMITATKRANNLRKNALTTLTMKQLLMMQPALKVTLHHLRYLTMRQKSIMQ